MLSGPLLPKFRLDRLLQGLWTVRLGAWWVDTGQEPFDEEQSRHPYFFLSTSSTVAPPKRLNPTHASLRKLFLAR